MSTVLTYREAKDDDGVYIVIDAWIPKCNRMFFGAAFIFDPGSNPLISISSPLELDAIRAILEHAEGLSLTFSRK